MPAAALRKPYRITKPREKWTEEEHNRFLEGLKLHGREWKRIVAHVQTRSVAQVRSHAQKYFLKLEKAGQAQQVPPPRAKKRPARQTPLVMVRDGTPPMGLRRTARISKPSRRPTRVIHQQPSRTIAQKDFEQSSGSDADGLGDSNWSKSRGHSSSPSQNTSNSATLGGQTQQSSSSHCNLVLDMEAKPQQFSCLSGQELPGIRHHYLRYQGSSMGSDSLKEELGTCTPPSQPHCDVMKSDPFEADGVQMPSWEELDERMLCIFGEDIGTGQSMGNQQCSGSPGGSERTNVHEIAGMSFGAGSLDGSVPLFSKDFADFDDMEYMQDSFTRYLEGIDPGVLLAG